MGNVQTNYTGPPITLYSGINFTGTSQSVTNNCDISCLIGGVGNDTVNSIKIPDGQKATLFENGGFQGASIRLYADVADLSKLDMRSGTTWANQISSITLAKSDAIACVNQALVSTSTGSQMVFIYSGANYGGQYTYSLPMGKFLTQDMQNCGTQYGSIILPPGLVVKITLATGGLTIFRISIPDITTLQLTNEIIASIEIGQADASTTDPTTAATTATAAPTTYAPTTMKPTTLASSSNTTVTNAPLAAASPTYAPQTTAPTYAPLTYAPTYAPLTYAPTLKSVPTTVPPSNTNLYIGIGVGVGILVLLIILFMVFSSDSDSGSKSGSRSGSRSEQRFGSETEYDRGRLADTDSE